MSDRLFVKTRFADALLDDLPNAGLSGVKVADCVVRVDPATADDTPDNLRFELGWHADVLGIDGFGIGPEDMQFTPEGDPIGGWS